MSAFTNVLQRLTDLQAAVSGPTRSYKRNSEGHGDLSLQSLQGELDDIDSSSKTASSMGPPKKRNDSSSSTDSTGINNVDPYSESPESGFFEFGDSDRDRHDAGKGSSSDEEDGYVEQEKRLRRYSASLASHTATMFETYYQATSQEREASDEPASLSSSGRSSSSKKKTKRASVDDAQSASRETSTTSAVVNGTPRASAYSAAMTRV